MRRRLGYFRGLTRSDLVNQIYNVWTKQGGKTTKKLINQFSADKLKAVWFGLNKIKTEARQPVSFKQYQEELKGGVSNG